MVEKIITLKYTFYCSIRNEIIALDRRTFLLKEFIVSESSMWSMKLHNQYVFCGTVGEKLLLLDKSTFCIEKELVLWKKNIGIMYSDGQILFAASHDGKLFKIIMNNFEIDSLTKKVHKKMFACAGMYRNMLVTVSFPCSEVALRDKDTLEKYEKSIYYYS